MKSFKCMALAVACNVLLISTLVFAAGESPHSFQVGPQFAHIEYREPSISVKEKGYFWGIAGAYIYTGKLTYTLEGRLLYGKVDYSSPVSGRIDKVDDYLFEARMLAGYPLRIFDSISLMPFAGFAYRYLNDDSSGKLSTGGYSGYRRESNYFYSPIGLSGRFKLGEGWTAVLKGEYDLFWRGEQKSHLEDTSYGAGVSNSQRGGYGLRGSAALQKLSGNIAYSLEPYVNYWDISQSDTEYLGSGKGIYEPANKSTEVGILFSVIF